MHRTSASRHGLKLFGLRGIQFTILGGNIFCVVFRDQCCAAGESWGQVPRQQCYITRPMHTRVSSTPCRVVQPFDALAQYRLNLLVYMPRCLRCRLRDQGLSLTNIDAILRGEVSTVPM